MLEKRKSNTTFKLNNYRKQRSKRLWIKHQQKCLKRNKNLQHVAGWCERKVYWIQSAMVSSIIQRSSSHVHQLIFHQNIISLYGDGNHQTNHKTCSTALLVDSFSLSSSRANDVIATSASHTLNKDFHLYALISFRFVCWRTFLFTLAIVCTYVAAFKWTHSSVRFIKMLKCAHASSKTLQWQRQRMCGGECLMNGKFMKFFFST